MTEPKDICQIDCNLSSLEQLFPENANQPQNTTSIVVHFNNIASLNNSIFHLLPRLVKLDLSANKLDNFRGGASRAETDLVLAAVAAKSWFIARLI